MNTEEIIELANQSQLFLSIWIDDEGDEIASLVAFAKLVEDFATAKEREGLVRIIEANIADEREACAREADWCIQNHLEQHILERIRARDGTPLRGVA